MSIRGKLRDIAIDLDNGWDDLQLKLMRSLGGPGPLRILAYRGIGRPDRLMVRGRVLVDRGPTTYESDDDFWDDLVLAVLVAAVGRVVGLRCLYQFEC